MGRRVILLCCLLKLFHGEAQSYVDTHSVRLNLSESTVKPGSIGHLSFHWDDVPENHAIELSIDATEDFTFISLPNIENAKAGSSTLLFMVHPFTAMGGHEITLTLSSAEGFYTKCTSVIIVESRPAIESTVLIELRDQTEILHINAGNIPLEIEGVVLDPGASFRANYPRDQNSFISVYASATDWDTTYTFFLKKRFYPSVSQSEQRTKSFRTRYNLHQQLANTQSFSNARFLIKEDPWLLRCTVWDRNIQGALSCLNGKNSLTLGKENFQPSALLKPQRSKYLVAHFLGWGGSLYGSGFTAHKEWTLPESTVKAGGLFINGQLMPRLNVHSVRKEGQFSYEAIGRLQDAIWEQRWNTFTCFGRFLYVPEYFTSRAVQQSHLLIGNSYKMGTFHWSSQSVFYNQNGLNSSTHHGQIQLKAGKFQIASRGFYSSPANARGVFQATYRSGSHSLSFNHQRTMGKSGSSNGWNAHYSFRCMKSNFAFSAQSIGELWTIRSALGATMGDYSLSAQASYSNYALRPIARGSLTRNFDSHSVSLVFNQQGTMQLFMRGALWQKNYSRKLHGVIEDHEGNGLSDVVIECEGELLQTDQYGRFAFHGLGMEEALLEIHAESMPFAHFPYDGYLQKVLLHKKNNSVKILCYATGGVTGSLFTEYSNGPVMRELLHYNRLVISLIGRSTTYNSPVDASGNFRISGISPGEYEVHLLGLPPNFSFPDSTITLEDGEIHQLDLKVFEAPLQIPMQQL